MWCYYSSLFRRQSGKALDLNPDERNSSLTHWSKYYHTAVTAASCFWSLQDMSPETCFNDCNTALIEFNLIVYSLWLYWWPVSHSLNYPTLTFTVWLNKPFWRAALTQTWGLLCPNSLIWLFSLTLNKQGRLLRDLFINLFPRTAACLQTLTRACIHEAPQRAPNLASKVLTRSLRLRVI